MRIPEHIGKHVPVGTAVALTLEDALFIGGVVTGPTLFAGSAMKLPIDNQLPRHSTRTRTASGQVLADLDLSAPKEAHMKSVPAVKWIESDVAADTTTDFSARRLPSVFGRLVSVALRSIEPGTPQPGQADSISAVGCAQREAHRAVFDEWLNLSLAQQWADLEGYAAWSSSDVEATFGQWLTPERLQRLMPQDVLEAQSMLFLGELDVLRELSRRRS